MLTYIRGGKNSYMWALPGSNFLTQTCLIHFLRDGFSIETKKMCYELYPYQFFSPPSVTLIYIMKGKSSYRWASPGRNLLTQTSMINWWRYVFHFQSRCTVTLTYIKRSKISYGWGSPGSNFLTQTCLIYFSRDGFSIWTKEINLTSIHIIFKVAAR